jgi:predicted patatin/cPLA2 family phospholipase
MADVASLSGHIFQGGFVSCVIKGTVSRTFDVRRFIDQFPCIPDHSVVVIVFLFQKITEIIYTFDGSLFSITPIKQRAACEI